MKTKVIAFDIYGTLFPTEDPDAEVFPVRTGALSFLERCKNLNLTPCTSSDSSLANLLIDLNGAKIKKYFGFFFQMEPLEPKDFPRILYHYKLRPSELFVIGDSPSLDIEPAIASGCNTLQVPRYVNIRTGNTDISKIIIL